MVDEFNQNKLKRHLLFLALALVAILLNGYHFGTFDQVFHIPFLKVWDNPHLYPTDPFVGLKEYHFSYFWFLFLPFYRLGILEPTLFITHILVTYGTFWMFWELSEEMFHNKIANVLVTFALLFPHLGFPGFQIIEFSLLNRTFAIPFLLAALLFYLRKRYGWSFLLIGLMFDIHLVYAAFLMAMIAMDMLFRFREMQWKKILPGILFFFIAILPLLIRKDNIAPGFDLSLRPELRDMEALSTLYTVYYPIGKIPYVIAGTVQGLACLAMILIPFRRHPAGETDRTMKHFLIAIALVILVGSIASYLLPVTLIIQFQLIRIGVFLLYYAYLYFAWHLANELQNNTLSTASRVLLIFSYAVVIFPVVPLLFWWGRKWFKARKALPVAILFILAMGVSEVYGAVKANYFAPGIYIYGPRSEWRAAQEWAKANTPNHATFITPPYEFWHYEPDWRVFSERGAVATIPEFMVLHLNPDFMPGFLERFEDLAPGVIENLDGDYNHTFANTRKAFESLTDADFTRISQKYQAGYLVLPVTQKVSFPVVYQNSRYVIYRVP